MGGSLGGWGDEWFRAFDRVVFLWLPPALRLTRLRAREQRRHGAVLATDPAQAARTAAFLTWAAGYDDDSCGGTRTLANHERRLPACACPVLELRGNLTVVARVAAVAAFLRTL